MPTAHDPSTSSYYVNDALYRRLQRGFEDCQRDGVLARLMQEYALK